MPKRMHDFQVGDVCVAQAWRTDEWPAVVVALDCNTSGHYHKGAITLRFIPYKPKDWGGTAGDLVWSDITVASKHWKRVGHIDIEPEVPHG